MSTSKTITRTDLTNILNEVLPPVTLNPWASMYIEGITANNTATKVTGVTLSSGGNASDYFDIGVANQITIKRQGTYKITCYFRTSAITSAGNVKRIACYANENENAVAMSRLNSWEDCMSVTFRNYNVGDVLTMYKRAEDGNSTYGAARILVEALNATTGTPMTEADYIVEQGTSGGWTYRKWNSGIAEAWKRTSDVTYAMTNTVGGNGYTSDYWTLPSGVFTSVTTANINRIDGGNGLIGFTIYSTTTSRIDHYVWITGTTGTVTMQLGITIVGTWK